MSAAAIRGWCPGALRPMPSGDGLVVRIRPRAGRLDAAEAAGIAAVARRHGNGRIDLTTRAHLQLRGVPEHGHAALVADLRALGLVDPDPSAEARRNILVTPFWRPGDGTRDLAEALSDALRDGPPLPAKFGFAVDTGPHPVLATASADIRIERARDGGLVLRADGAALGMRVTAAEAPGAALALARWFLDSGGAPEGRGRMAAHLAHGARPAGAQDTPPAPPLARPRPGRTPHGWLLAGAFGALDAAGLEALAAAGAGLRLTPWRMVLSEAEALPAGAGLITAPDDPLLRVAACTGAPGCPQAHAATRPLARALAPHLPPGAFLHVSGCAKGCAHAGPAPLTLTAGPNGFALIRGGSASGVPTRMLGAEALLADPSLLYGTPDAP